VGVHHDSNIQDLAMSHFGLISFCSKLELCNFLHVLVFYSYSMSSTIVLVLYQNDIRSKSHIVNIQNPSEFIQPTKKKSSFYSAHEFQINMIVR
jgi:hypothetical protein